MAKDENRPIQSSGLETREGNMITLGFAGVIVLSFLPFADYVFIPLLGLVVLSTLWVFGKALWAATTLDRDVAFGPLSAGELKVQAAAIEEAILVGMVRGGDVVADGILVDQAWVTEVHARQATAQTHE